MTPRRKLTGIAVTETVPDAVAAAGQRVDLLDVGPRGCASASPKLSARHAEWALAGYFRETWRR